MSQKIICKSCETEILQGSSFCANCGTKVDFSRVDYLIERSEVDPYQNIVPEITPSPLNLPHSPIDKANQKKWTPWLKVTLVINYVYFVVGLFIVSMVLFVLWLFNTSLTSMDDDFSDFFFLMIVLTIVTYSINESLKRYSKLGRFTGILFAVSQIIWVPRVFSFLDQNIIFIAILFFVIQLYALIIDKQTRMNFNNSVKSQIRG